MPVFLGPVVFAYEGIWAKLTVTESGLLLCQGPPGAIRHCHTLFVVSQRIVPVSSRRSLWLFPGG